MDLKISIKTRIWLLGLLFLGSLLLVFGLQYQLSGKELTSHRTMLDQLAQAERMARLVHEVQKERGLSSAFLADAGDSARKELSAQRIATDFRLSQVDSAQEPALLPGLGAMREKVDQTAVEERESFDFYTLSLNGIFERMDRLSLAANGHPAQHDLIALVHLVRAKEYLGQARATVLAMPGKGRPDPAWHAAMGSRFGLFEAGIQRFLKESSPSMRATLTGALGEPAMQSSMRLLRAARDGRAIDPISMPRTRWYGIVTEAINLLREVERYSLIELIDQTQAIHDKVRAEILLQRGGLLLISVLLTWLAISSLLLLMRAFESVLRGARRAAGKQEWERGVKGMRDEPIDIAQSFNQLLDMVDSLNIKASTDALTGALNRHGFHELAGGELQRALRYHRKLSMIIADVDHFKRINDSHGHAVGDRVLIELACLIRDNMRGTDIFARWGGEEFIILAPETSAEEAARLAEKLRLLFETFHAKDLPKFTVSFGVAEFAKGDNLEALFAKADQALYLAKDTGRNRVETFTRTDAKSGPRPSSRNIRVVSDRSRA